MELDRAVYLILTAGSLASFALFAAGLAADLALSGSEVSMHLFTSAIAVLLLTPQASLVAALAVFAESRELSNALVCLAVLSVVSLAVLAGFVFHVSLR